MSNIRLQQTLVIGAIVLLLAFLFTRNVKGLVKPAERGQPETTAQAAAPENTLNLDDVSRSGKNMISNALAQEITALEEKYKRAGANEKTQIAAQLARKWEDVEQMVPSAMYLELIAGSEHSLKSWVRSGEGYLKAFENSTDSLSQPALLQKANSSFAEALAIDSTDLSAKTGMGITIVNGMGMPMQGITMLLDVVKHDPKNVRVIMQLGMFSIRSGQFDKAVDRFKQAIAIKPTPEAYFYLATAYENLGKNEEAIAAFSESKKIAANPTLTGFIDKKIAELRSK